MARRFHYGLLPARLSPVSAQTSLTFRIRKQQQIVKKIYEVAAKVFFVEHSETKLHLLLLPTKIAMTPPRLPSFTSKYLFPKEGLGFT